MQKTKLPALLILLVIIIIVSCSKSGSGSTTPALDGIWQTTVVAGTNDTINVKIYSGTGVISSISAIAADSTRFALHDTLFSNIAATVAAGIYSATGTYKYGPGDSSVGHTSATLTLLNATEMLVHFGTDPLTSISPADDYYNKQ
jgi:hypothetical protein